MYNEHFSSILCYFKDAEIKGKMRNLRTQFGKELGKVKVSISSGAGTNEVYTPTWKYYEQLQFLRDSITPVKTKPTPGVFLIEEDNADHITVDSEDENYDTVLDPPRKTEGSVAKIKRKIEDKVLDKSLTLLQDVSNKRKKLVEEDGDLIFGKHVCHSLRDIKDKQKKELVKLKIQQLLYQCQFSNMSQQENNIGLSNPWGSNFPNY